MNILCAYNANIDSISHIDGKRLSRLLEGQTGDAVHERLKKLPAAISSRADFFAGLVTCMQHGNGAEWMISDIAVFDWLKETFLADSLMRMGGNMGIMANVLSELGASRVIPNVANLSRLQASFFSQKAIFHPFKGKLYDSRAISNVLPAANKSPELIHFVFDFKKGETLRLHDEDITAPRENRFIATYDPLNFSLCIDQHFRDYAHQHASEMDGAIVSGYHLLQENEIQGHGNENGSDEPGHKHYGYKEKLGQSLEQLKSWKNIREDLHIHVEFGHFSSGNIASYAFSILSPVVDRIGMNEDELAMLARINGMDAGAILAMDPVAIAETAIELCSAYGLCRMLVHTREFVLSVSCKKDEEPEKIIEAMDFGLKCAAAFACSGKLADRDTMLGIALGIKESEYGLSACSKLARHMEKKWTCSQVCGLHMSFQVTIIPTRICDEPVSTVGLGDTISAAIFLRELELLP
jgi:ADP-dependent phosphofructokinase/glucokinase